MHFSEVTETNIVGKERNVSRFSVYLDTLVSESRRRPDQYILESKELCKKLIFYLKV